MSFIAFQKVFNLTHIPQGYATDTCQLHGFPSTSEAILGKIWANYSHEPIDNWLQNYSTTQSFPY